MISVGSRLSFFPSIPFCFSQVYVGRADLISRDWLAFRERKQSKGVVAQHNGNREAGMDGYQEKTWLWEFLKV